MMSTRRKINKILKEKGLTANLEYDGSGASADEYGWWTITFDKESADFLASQDWPGTIEISDLEAGFEELSELPVLVKEQPHD